MLSMVARRSAQAGVIGLRQFGTRGQPKKQGFQALKVSYINLGRLRLYDFYLYDHCSWSWEVP